MASVEVTGGEFSWDVLYHVVVISVSIIICGSIKECCGKKSRKKAGKSKKKKGSSSMERGWSDLQNIDRDDQMEDTFEYHKPKREEAKRAKDIKDAKAYNAGDYKTWNKLMNDDNDFEKPIQKDLESR